MDLDTSFLAGHDLAVYSATWCPDCTRLKRWLGTTDIVTRDVNIDDVDGAAEKLEEETGKRAIPFVLVEGPWYEARLRQARTISCISKSSTIAPNELMAWQICVADVSIVETAQPIRFE